MPAILVVFVIALALVTCSSRADQALEPSQIDSTRRIILAGGALFSRSQRNKQIASPDSLQTQGPASVSDVSTLSINPRGWARSFVDRAKDQVWVSDFPGFDATGANDSSPAFTAAVASCPASGCTIRVPTVSAKIKMGATVILKPGITLEGAAQAPGYKAATVLQRVQSSGPIFLLPGTASLSPGASTGIRITGLALDGGNVNLPVVSAPEVNPGRGTWNVEIDHVSFYNARPGISAINAWDWWVHDNAFIACGSNPATATSLSASSCLYIGNSTQSNYAGANSNSWRITDNFIDTSIGRGIVSDSTLGKYPNNFMSIKGNHFGVRGYESIFGCLRDSSILGNLSEGSIAGYPIFDLKSGSGCGFNTIIGNHLAAPGAFAIVDNGASDLVASNSFNIKGSATAWIQLGASSGNVSVMNNKADDSPCCNTIPMVSDLGSLNTVMWNDGSDGMVINGHLPFKKFGQSYLIPTDLSHLRPKQSAVSQLPTCNASTQGHIRVVYDANAPTYNATVVGGGLVWTTVLCNSVNWTAH
ncbi:hypothetical protein [Methylobacterium sp. Leaf113]|uniref:hypothetical protein n=1 Tax=Methylobacterium sp. Leaf113 TaxID=1736259 RepID=UPI000A98387B|nr:hypothetical protein [Methylobacterium sp. Leaf113]